MFGDEELDCARSTGLKIATSAALYTRARARALGQAQLCTCTGILNFDLCRHRRSVENRQVDDVMQATTDPRAAELSPRLRRVNCPRDSYSCVCLRALLLALLVTLITVKLLVLCYIYAFSFRVSSRATKTANVRAEGKADRHERDFDKILEENSLLRSAR